MSNGANNDNTGAFMTEVDVQDQEPVSRVEDETFLFQKIQVDNNYQNNHLYL